MKVAHTAGTETEFSKNDDGMKVLHTAGTETDFSKLSTVKQNVSHRSNLTQSPSLFEADGAARRNARSD